MDGILGLLGSSSGESAISGLLGGLLGGGMQSNPLSALLGGGQNQGDSISSTGKALSTIMDVAQIAALFI